MSTFKDN